MDVDEFSEKLDDIGDTLTFEELFPDAFISEHTKNKYKTCEEFFKKSGFNTDNQEEFDSIQENRLNELDDYIIKEMDFKDWQEMIDEAGNRAIEKRLNN